MKVGYLLNVEVYNDIQVFESLKPEWNDLVNRSAANTIFLTWEWQSTWWNAYHPGNLWVVACRNDEGQLIGIAPWFIGESDQSVHFIGCEDVTDYLDVIVDVNHIDAVMEVFAAFLQENHTQYQKVSLCNIPAASPTLEKLTGVLNGQGFETTVEQQEVCPVFDVPETWEDYLMLLDKKQRHEVRRKLRRAESASEEVDWYTVDASHDIAEQVERFFSLMVASDEQKQIFLQDEANKVFFRQMVPIMFEQGWLNLNFLVINGHPSAAYLNFIYNNRMLVYNSGLDIGEYGHLSPGILLLVNNIRYAIDNGLNVFDFLRGDETYKYRMGGQNTEIYKLSAWIENG